MIHTNRIVTWRDISEYSVRYPRNRYARNSSRGMRRSVFEMALDAPSQRNCQCCGLPLDTQESGPYYEPLEPLNESQRRQRSHQRRMQLERSSLEGPHTSEWQYFWPSSPDSEMPRSTVSDAWTWPRANTGLSQFIYEGPSESTEQTIRSPSRRFPECQQWRGY